MLASLWVVMSGSPMPSPEGSFTLTLGPSGGRGTGPGESALLVGHPSGLWGFCAFPSTCPDFREWVTSTAPIPEFPRRRPPRHGAGRAPNREHAGGEP